MAANLTTKLGQLVDVLTPDTTNTRIGVANASPTRTLDVTGTGAFSSLLTAAGGVSSTLVTDATSATTGSILTAGGISMQKALWVGTTSRLVGNVQADALVAIGTTSVTNPQASRTILQISTMGMIDALVNQPQIRISANEYINTSGASTYIATNVASNYSQSQGAHLWFYAASGTAGAAISFTQAMTLDASGRLGIGMTPSNILDITQTQNSSSIAKITNASAGAAAIAYFSASNGTSNINVAVFGTGYTTAGVTRSNGGYIGCGAAGGLTFNTEASQPIYFGINSGEVARFTSAGNLLLGATAAVDANEERLLVKYTAPKTGATFVCSSTGGNYAIVFRNPNGQVGDITTNGSATSYTTSSDYRLKETVQPMTGGLATISALKPVNYDWIIDKTAGEGFIAHELQAVIPAAVTGEKDAVNEDGSIKPQGVDFSKIVPHLVAAIQELTTRLAALESK
jgi:hypothetical protein